MLMVVIENFNFSDTTGLVEKSFWFKTFIVSILSLTVFIPTFQLEICIFSNRDHFSIDSKAVLVIYTNIPRIFIFLSILFTFFIKAFLYFWLRFVISFPIHFSGKYFISGGVCFFIDNVENFLDVFVFHWLDRWGLWCIKSLGVKRSIFI